MPKSWNFSDNVEEKPTIKIEPDDSVTVTVKTEPLKSDGVKVC